MYIIRILLRHLSYPHVNIFFYLFAVVLMSENHSAFACCRFVLVHIGDSVTNDIRSLTQKKTFILILHDYMVDLMLYFYISLNYPLPYMLTFYIDYLLIVILNNIFE